MTPATQQRQLPGGRTSAVVPKGTSPTEAARAAKEATTNPKAPSAQGGKGGKGGKTAAAMGDYDAAPPAGAAGGDASDVQVIPGFGELVQGEDPEWDAAMAKAMKDVKDKHMPENITTTTDERGRAMMPGGQGSLVNKFRAVFSRDRRPDAPTGTVSDEEKQKREEYMSESQRVAEAMRHGGRPRDSSGRFAASITTTTHGAVQVRGANGQIREVVRAPYRAEKGQVASNIEAPIAATPEKLTEAVDKRLKAYGESLFQDRAGLTPRRLAAMRLAFALDRKDRGWEIPDWGLTL